MSIVKSTELTLYKFIFTKESVKWIERIYPQDNYDFLNHEMRSYQKETTEDGLKTNICCFYGPAKDWSVIWIPEKFLTRIKDK
jgi:hypothetical protein